MTTLLMLPDEVKLKIFEYLSGVDKIELLKVCKDLQRIGLDYAVLQRLNFAYNYKLSLSKFKFIARKQTAQLVTYLNVNGVHWIPSGQLRNILSKFINLTSLHVLDTHLSIRDLVTTLTNTTKVKKLSFSITPDSCGDIFEIKLPLQPSHLYITYNTYSIRPLIGVLMQFSELEELWMIALKNPFDTDTVNDIPWLSFPMSSLPKVKKKIVLNRRISKTLANHVFLNSIKAENGNWKCLNEMQNDNLHFEVYENLNTSITRNEDNFEKILSYVNANFKLTDLFCPEDIREIFLKNKSFTDMKYNSLNLAQNEFLNLNLDTHGRYIEKLLFSETMNKLRKLKCQSIIFWESKVSEDIKPNLFKKRRIGLKFDEVDENSRFAKFTKFATDIEDFEIIDTDTKAIKEKLWQLDTLTFIQNWKILKKLTITSINFNNGKFLIDITKNCPMLSCLKIKDDRVQDYLSNHLCEALKYSKNLKDFRYERKGAMPVDQLFKSLTKCEKLERLYIQCQLTSKISKNPLETLITRCVNLVFLFIFISQLHETVCKSIERSINEFEEKPQIICIKGRLYNLRNILYEDIPSCHVEEIVCQSNDFHSDYLKSFH